MKKVLWVFIIAILINISLNAGGFSFKKAIAPLKFDDYKASIVKVYGINNYNNLIIYDAAASANFIYTELPEGETALFLQNTVSELSNTEVPVGNTTKECEVVLHKGFNIVSLPTMDLSNTINGATIKKVYGINDNNDLVIYDASASYNFILNKAKEGKYYLILAESDSTGSCNTPVSPDVNSSIQPPSIPLSLQ